MVTDDQLSYITTFSGAPDTWGLLLRTIDVRPKQLTCIGTSIQKIIAACEDIVNIYDAVTFVLQQSLQAPESVAMIRDTPDGAILFFAHSHSVTMWDVQTGGLIHTFIQKSEINDIIVSTTGDHIVCGLSDGSVTSWNIHTKKGRGFKSGQPPVVTTCWLSPLKLAIATQGSVYIRDIAAGETSDCLPIPGPVWGMVYLGDRNEFLVGTSWPGEEADQELCTLESIEYTCGRLYQRPGTSRGWKSSMSLGNLLRPTLVGKSVVCITYPGGVQSFDTRSRRWTRNPPLLDAATSVTVSLNRNLVVQTKDSIQIFSLDVLTSGEARNNARPSHVYPLGENYIICLLQPDGHLALLELETLHKLSPDDEISSLRSLLTNRAPSARRSAGHGLVAQFGVSAVMQAWRSGTPLPGRIEATEEDEPLSGLSPERTRIARVYTSPRRELRLKDAEDGTTLAKTSLGHGKLAVGEVYDVTFDSETKFYLKIDGPGWHVQVPYEIIPSPLGRYSHTMIQGEPVPLPKPQATPYSLDTNCEWVIDAESRKICWISPGNVRRGDGGHFWAGLSLVMVGDDGVVRKLTFKEPNC